MFYPLERYTKRITIVTYPNALPSQINSIPVCIYVDSRVYEPEKAFPCLQVDLPMHKIRNLAKKTNFLKFMRSDATIPVIPSVLEKNQEIELREIWDQLNKIINNDTP